MCKMDITRKRSLGYHEPFLSKESHLAYTGRLLPGFIWALEIDLSFSAWMAGMSPKPSISLLLSLSRLHLDDRYYHFRADQAIIFHRLRTSRHPLVIVQHISCSGHRVVGFTCHFMRPAFHVSMHWRWTDSRHLSVYWPSHTEGLMHFRLRAGLSSFSINDLYKRPTGISILRSLILLSRF